MALTFLGAAASPSSNTDAVITLATTVPAGAMVVIIGCVKRTDAALSADDSKGNTYTQRDVFSLGPDMRIGHHDATITTELVPTDTINWDSAGGLNNCGFYAWAVDTTGFDGTYTSNNAEGRGTGTAVSSNLQNLVTTNADDYLMGAIGTNVPSTLTGVTAGWNAESTASVTSSDVDLRVFGFSQTVAVATTYPFSGTLGASAEWESIAVGYKYTPGAAMAASIVQQSDRLRKVQRAIY